jgi:DNA-binding transcriptional regulator YdaS (Cro superfamily)
LVPTIHFKTVRSVSILPARFSQVASIVGRLQAERAVRD